MRVEYIGGHVATSPETSNHDVYQCDLGENEWITEVKLYKGPNWNGQKTNIIGLEYLTNRNRSCGVHGSESEEGFERLMWQRHQGTNCWPCRHSGGRRMLRASEG